MLARAPLPISSGTWNLLYSQIWAQRMEDVHLVYKTDAKLDSVNISGVALSRLTSEAPVRLHGLWVSTIRQ